MGPDDLLCSRNARSRKDLARVNGTSRRASGWAGEKAARSGRSISPHPLEEEVSEHGRINKPLILRPNVDDHSGNAKSDACEDQTGLGEAAPFPRPRFTDHPLGHAQHACPAEKYRRPPGRDSRV